MWPRWPARGARKAAIDAVHVWIDEILAIAYDRKRIQRLVMFNVVARQTVGYSDEEAALRDGLIAPLLQALRRGLATDPSPPPTPSPMPMPSSIWCGVWPVPTCAGSGRWTEPRPGPTFSGSPSRLSE